MDMYLTLDEAIDAAREAFLAEHDNDTPQVSQLNLQKYILQDGDTLWMAEFHQDTQEEGDGVALFFGAAAQAIFDDDYDDGEITEEWQEESTLYQWDDDDFQYQPPLDSEEGESAAAEWDEQN
ncbi:MysB family protein [Edwardsiella piscicida]|uniref:MysB family protein n=1 Tax=Edwardsiella piscicida TaxID=1263550 RepID=UPI0002C12ADB|nr:MysB family protein [Edwardsiella piscicida]AGH73225.1 secY/secA suppressor protein [Edwardsiella piscicida C07-087]EKS7778911.1 secY/secA suppressor protein [Edwardsiella piscicida]EKS7782331.1 secY/secA suppressor protein [Edwardsiella piscicida]EKS7791970.1 secY/secA suppressor protein [Edwardsiella piscicida]EKS7812084.1 secY/secA suppressor protein [Edwardsiella piscicida]